MNGQAGGLQQKATEYFDTFCRAFATFDGKVVSKLFAVPYLAVGSDGSSRVFLSHGEIAEYFQDYLDTYKTSGCETCTYQDLMVIALGNNSALFTVTWHLLDSASHEVSAWRESYNVTIGADGIYAHGSTDHAT